MYSKQDVGAISPRVKEQMISCLQDKGIKDLAVLNAMRIVPRHKFVDEALAHRAYDEKTVLPIGHKQTLSDSYVVALMTESLLSGETPKRVLEIGTGSGYQTAILAKLVSNIYTVERIEALSERARDRFITMGITNVEMKLDDGHLGWIDKAPFDGIIVTAAPTGIPALLMEQLKVGGKMVLPVGPELGEQQLLELTKLEDGSYKEKFLEMTKFVPMRAGSQ